MYSAAVRTPAASARWPMTPAAIEALGVEIATIAGELYGAAAPSTARLEPLARARLERRLELLESILADASPVDDGLAAIGRAVTIRDEDGALARWSLVLPGDGDPVLGWVSIDSPLGLALAGRRAGDRATVSAPGGAWVAEVVAVG